MCATTVHGCNFHIHLNKDAMGWALVTILPIFFFLMTVTADYSPKPRKHAVEIEEVYVDIDQCVYETDEKFLSIALDSGLIRRRWENFDFSSEKIKNLARGLYPAFVRIGGTDEDFLLFSEESNCQTSHHEGKSKFTEHTNFTMNATDVDNIFQFADETGLNVLFGLNVLLRTSDMNWESANAEKLMAYIAWRGYSSGWELGNEPVDLKGLVNRTITGKQLAKDFQILRELLDKHPEYGQLVIGPDVSSPWNGRTRPKFLQEFLSNINASIDAVTYHQYYTNNKASVNDFYDPNVLDSLITEIEQVKSIIKKSGATLINPWLGETSSSYGGGVPGVSDSYIAGFMWLDKLGISARLAQNVVIRQTFYGGSYSLINNTSFDPFPDYWSSLLYKRLVGPKVLGVRDGLAYGRKFRVYAHCTSERSLFKAGSITVFVLNTEEFEVELTFMGKLRGLPVEQYLLTPGVDGNLTSQTAKLNGEHLRLLNDTFLPDIKPKTIVSPQKILIPPVSYGFFVIPDGNAKACKINYSYQKGQQHVNV